MQIPVQLAFALLISMAPLIEREMDVYEHASQTHQSCNVKLIDGQWFVPMELLTSKFGLQRKLLSPGKLGVCRNDRCIPFEVDEKSGAVRVINEVEWVPIRRLVAALGGRLLADSTANLLLIDLATQASSLPAFSGEPIDFELPDLSGKPIKLADFRGKKVLIFAWASW